MLSRNRLIQRIRSACSQRRLFSGERGAIAASLIEIGVAMLAVGILTAGAVTTFTGFLDSASDTTARGRLNDAASTADQVYNWLRPGGERCYSNTDCDDLDSDAIAALQEAAGGQLTFAVWNTAFPAENTIYVQITAPVATYARNNNATSTSTDHNGIVGNPADGQWIRMAVRSDSGATFCVIKVAQTSNPLFEGVGYKSVDSASSSDASTSAHCGGHNGSATATKLNLISGMSCVYGSGGESTGQGASQTARGVTTDTTTADCDNARSLGRPGPQTKDIDAI